MKAKGFFLQLFSTQSQFAGRKCISKDAGFSQLGTLS